MAWTHTHMDDFCGYSSIDVHNQYILENFVNENIVGIVVALCESGSNPIWNAFKLAEEYKQRVETCSTTRNLADVQHAQCDGVDHFFLFVSCGHLITEVDTPGKLMDFRVINRPVINTIIMEEVKTSDSSDNEVEDINSNENLKSDSEDQGKLSIDFQHTSELFA